MLANAHLRIDPNCVRLEVDAAARAPDSEVVSDRLKLLANAIGVKRSEVVDIDGEPVAENRHGEFGKALDRPVAIRRPKSGAASPVGVVSNPIGSESPRPPEPPLSRAPAGGNCGIECAL